VERLSRTLPCARSDTLGSTLGCRGKAAFANEYVGLAGSFLHGARQRFSVRCGVSRTESSARLIERFYERHVRDSAMPPAALRDAQRQLREHPRSQAALAHLPASIACETE
jgi:CHAT domain-containing protein